jgi:NADPH-dependent glutamate synthase beta subunit-like oxidoreductase
VTIYESNRELGGLLRTGIPAYRLPRDVLDDEIQYILDHGVHAATGAKIDNAGLLRLTREHAAIVVAAGLQESRQLDLGFDQDSVVVQALDFLDRARQQMDTLKGQEVVVVGGGNSAVDAARSARRLGAKRVHIIYRRTREEMPAIEEEIKDALEEGIILDELVAPLVLRRDTLGPLLTCQRMRLGELDGSGRRRPVPEDTEDAQFELRCDLVILALGQSADLSVLPADSEMKDGSISLGRTGAPVYSCGDFATNSGTVASAIGSGRRAAWTIHRALTGEDLFPNRSLPVATREVMRNGLIDPAPSRHSATLPASVRRNNFDEVRTGLPDGESDHGAQAEARRCLSCGVCTYCDQCMVHCPEGVIVREADGYRFDYSYCKGCGLCSEQCPRGGIAMINI